MSTEPAPIKMLTPDDLARLLGMSRKTVIDCYVKQDGFPQSVTGPRKPRWLASAVQDFFESKSRPNYAKITQQ